jgi:chemotaxis family two-component system sensor kinase Cph1
MTSKDPEADSAKTLRQRAEAVAGESAGENTEALLPEQARRTLHELRVHQIELEMQNQELRRTQEALESSRERYFNLYDLAPVGYLTLSDQGLILEANLKAAELLGVTRGVLVKQPLSRFVVREDQDIYYLYRKKLFDAGTNQIWELRMLKKDGAPFWVRVEASTEWDMSQQYDSASVWHAVLSDISESKRAEQAMKATNDELQEFSYALTHDLREPLRMVVNFTQLLAEEHKGKLGEEADQYVAYAVEGALRIQALLKDMLIYWTVTDQDESLHAVLDCNDVLSRALVNLGAAIQQSHAKVTSDRLPTVAAKEVVVMQLFQNLIGNSIKYRSERAPKIHVSAAKTAEGWQFSVKDNGIGIDPAHAGRVFGMFKRLHGREIPGTGIGLALCKKLVERHGGRIWVESEAGGGATFKFTIPSELPHG